MRRRFASKPAAAAAVVRAFAARSTFRERRPRRRGRRRRRERAARGRSRAQHPRGLPPSAALSRGPGRGRAGAQPPRERTGRTWCSNVPIGTTPCSRPGPASRIGEVLQEGDRLEVARGGRRGVGNARFKSSTNRAPRRSTPGAPGRVAGAPPRTRAPRPRGAPRPAERGKVHLSPCGDPRPGRGSPTTRSRPCTPILERSSWTRSGASCWRTFRASSRGRREAPGSASRSCAT